MSPSFLVDMRSALSPSSLIIFTLLSKHCPRLLRLYSRCFPNCEVPVLFAAIEVPVLLLQFPFHPKLRLSSFVIFCKSKVTRFLPYTNHSQFCGSTPLRPLPAWCDLFQFRFIFDQLLPSPYTPYLTMSLTGHADHFHFISGPLGWLSMIVVLFLHLSHGPVLLTTTPLVANKETPPWQTRTKLCLHVQRATHT